MAQRRILIIDGHPDTNPARFVHALASAYAKGAAWNESHWANENVDKLLLAARSELDGTERRDMHHEMQQIVSTEPSLASRPPSGYCRDRASSPS